MGLHIVGEDSLSIVQKPMSLYLAALWWFNVESEDGVFGCCTNTSQGDNQNITIFMLTWSLVMRLNYYSQNSIFQSIFHSFLC